MALRTKPETPIDRAEAELARQIATIEQQLRRLESPKVESRTGVVKRFVKEMLTPPPRRPAPMPRRDLFDLPADPLKELDGGAVAMTTPVEQKEKLAHYLGAGSVTTFKPLKHVARRQRQQFYLWVGLSIVAVILLWAVVH